MCDEAKLGLSGLSGPLPTLNMDHLSDLDQRFSRISLRDSSSAPTEKASDASEETGNMRLKPLSARRSQFELFDVTVTSVKPKI